MKKKILPTEDTDQISIRSKNYVTKCNSSMVDDQQVSIEVNSNNFIKEPSCAGRNCENLGINNLRIILIKKTAWFCQKCADDLINLDLVE